MIKSTIVTKTDETHSMSQTLGEIWSLKDSDAVSDPCGGMLFMNISILGYLKWKKSLISNFIPATDHKESYKNHTEHA